MSYYLDGETGHPDDVDRIVFGGQVKQFCLIFFNCYVETDIKF